MKDKRIKVNHEPIFNPENSQKQKGIFAHFAECDISRNCEAFSAFSFSNCCERTSFQFNILDLETRGNAP